MIELFNSILPFQSSRNWQVSRCQNVICNKCLNQIIEFIRGHCEAMTLFPCTYFGENEKSMVLDTIQSTLRTFSGKYVDKFEQEFANYTNSNNAVAVVNGTAALHVGLVSLNLTASDMVITQA